MSWNMAPIYSSSGSYLSFLRSPVSAPNRKTRREWLYSRSGFGVAHEFGGRARHDAVGYLDAGNRSGHFWFLRWQWVTHACFQASAIVTGLLISFATIDLDIRLTGLS